MEQRLSLITLGVTDLDKARAFYGRLGWTETPGSSADVAFFQAGGMILGLWDREDLAEDSVMVDQGGWGGVTLAYNTRSVEEVDEIIEDARQAGATIGREPAETFWGGYSGLFIDPSGHPWEVAHNPGWTINDDGTITAGKG